MGHGGQLTCFSCGYSQEVFFGIGFAHCGAFEVLADNETVSFSRRLRACIPNRTERNLVIDLLKNKNGAALAYGYGLYRCPKCGKFHNKFHYQIKHDGGMYEPEYECGKCAVKLDYLGDEAENEAGTGQIDVSKYQCPKCGAHELILGGGIMWD